MDVLGQDRREGLGRKADSRVGLLLLILVSLILLLSSLYAAEASVFRKARETVIDAASPVLTLFAGPIAYVQDVIGDARDYFNILEQNKALREENTELRQWMGEARSMRETIASFEKLQTYHAPPDAVPVDAFVIGESNEAYVHSMILNAGAADGVGRGQAVVDGRGLVGRVVDIGRRASRILLLTDVQSRIPVYVEGAYIEGILAGRTNARPTIVFTQSADISALAPGQKVFTSGAGGALPRGIAVGRIIRTGEDGAVIELDANYTRTRLVRVINYQFAAPGDAVGNGETESEADAGDGDGADDGADDGAAGEAPEADASTDASDANAEPLGG